MTSHTISVVIPVYNSERSLPELVRRLEPVLRDIAREYEVVLVNDGSKDRSWQVIERLSADHRCVRGINMMRNYGQHNAVLAGVRAARFATVVTMDDDLQHPPEELPALITKLDEGFDVVYGVPERQQHGILRGLASVIMKIALQGAMGAKAARIVSAWRAFRTQLRGGFSSYNSPFVNVDVLLTWATTNFGSVRVRHEPRTIGESNYSFRTLLQHAITMMTGFSVLPLQLASFIGFAFTAFGLGVLAYVVGRYFVSGSPVAGFPFLASIIAIFSGAQLFALGIVGEYVARMFFRTMDKPAYAVRAMTGTTDGPPDPGITAG